MKELSVEEKAKRYNEALERAKKLYEQGTITESLSYIFPELKESEDERIRKELIEHIKANKEADYVLFKKFSPDDVIAWLEKQGGIDNYPLECSTNTVMTDLKKNQIKPKFKVGDWITDGYVGGQITSIEDNYPCYKIADFIGGINTSIPFTLQDNYHLWSIEDAKDGDVLAESKGDIILMFRGIGNTRWDDVIDYHFYYDCYRENFIVQEDVNYWGNTENNQLKPATKEQRDTLMKAIADACYTWDAKEKQLKEVDSYCQEHCKGYQETGKCFADGECKAKREAEQKPTDEEMKEALRTEYEKGRADAIVEMQKTVWSEEDEEELDIAISTLKEAGQYDSAKWLKSLKDRVQPKQEWSEEDDLILETIIDHIIPDKPFIANGFTDEELVTWLKSLRPQNRWKPSDEQLEALKNAIHIKPFENPSDSILWGLYEQLKKLK